MLDFSVSSIYLNLRISLAHLPLRIVGTARVKAAVDGNKFFGPREIDDGQRGADACNNEK